MTTSFLLVQLTDTHIGGTWGFGDPVAGLAAAIEAVLRLNREPDAVLITGDLANSGEDADYDVLRELLAPLTAPIYVVAGNHDDRAALRRHFDVPGGDQPGGAQAPIQYAVDLGPLRLLVLDTTKPGQDAGELGADRLGWLDAALADEPELPTLVAMHHPPLSVGIAQWDAIGLSAGDRGALADVIARHPQVRRLVAGHVHRAIASDLGGRAVLAVPSTYVQAKLDLGSDEIALGDEPPGFAVHVLVGGELISHIQPVG